VINSNLALINVLSQRSKEGMFLRQLFGELEGTDHCSVVVREDNQAGIAIAKNPVF